MFTCTFATTVLIMTVHRSRSQTLPKQASRTKARSILAATFTKTAFPSDGEWNSALTALKSWRTRRVFSQILSDDGIKFWSETLQEATNTLGRCFLHSTRRKQGLDIDCLLCRLLVKWCTCGECFIVDIGHPRCLIVDSATRNQRKLRGFLHSTKKRLQSRFLIVSCTRKAFKKMTGK